MLSVYNLLINVYGFSIRLAGLFSPKARRWWQGRSRLWTATTAAGQKLNRPLWIHCASLGEFEQGRPLIEEIKKRFPDLSILLSFFSPSGFEIRKNYPLVDEILYLPLDTRANAIRFLHLINPRCAIFIKYDFWFNFLNQLHHRSIPFIYVSVVMSENHFLLRPWSRSLLDILSRANHIFVQDELTAQRLGSKEISQIDVVGDTRIDRVLQLQNETKRYPDLEVVTGERDAVIFGSVWPSDWDVIADFLGHLDSENYIAIVAPHEINDKSLAWWVDKLGDSTQRLSRLSPSPEVSRVLVDTIGDLAYLYRDAKLAFVGGGFDQGIHSILEPAAALVPVIFGPRHQKFREAQALIDLDVARSVETNGDFQKAANYFLHEVKNESLKHGLNAFLSSSKGATRKIIDYLVAENLLHEKE